MEKKPSKLLLRYPAQKCNKTCYSKRGMSFKNIFSLVLGLVLVVLSGLWSSTIANTYTKLSKANDYTYYLTHTENNRFGLKDDWSGNIISNSKIEISSTEKDSATLDIEKIFTVESITGEVLFKLTQPLLVDRVSRHNLPNITDKTGIAYSDFPADTQKTDYVWWPATFGSPFNMKFIGETRINNLLVYHFQSLSITLDDTSGYAFLPLVPEKYKVLSTASIDAFIEPVTGTLIDYADKGVSFYSSDSIQRYWDIAQWSNQFTKSVVEENINGVKSKIFTFTLHKSIIPSFIFFLGILLIFSPIILKKK